MPTTPVRFRPRIVRSFRFVSGSTIVHCRYPSFVVGIIVIVIVSCAGIQLADELGFKESLSTLEQNSKRRSVNGLPAPGSFEPLVAASQLDSPNTVSENARRMSSSTIPRTATFDFRVYHVCISINSQGHP